jgi:hypothetical protein
MRAILIFFVLSIASLSRAAVCSTSVIYCSDQLDGSPWVDGILGCAKYFLMAGGDPADAVCNSDKCRYLCGSDPCDLNQGCTAGSCQDPGCISGLECLDGSTPWLACDKYDEPYHKVISLPTGADCVLGNLSTVPLLIVTCNYTFTDFDINFCLGSCTPECPHEAVVLSAFGADTCTECTSGADCASAFAGNDICDMFTLYYSDTIVDFLFPGDPPFTHVTAWHHNRCVSRCTFHISDARVGIYVNYSSVRDLESWDPVPVPPGRAPIAIEGDLIKARPGYDDILSTCVVPTSNLQCDTQPGGPYIRSIATMMDTFGLAINAAYCVTKCPAYAGKEVEGVDSCRTCSSLLANGCQYRNDSRDVCDEFIKFLPGDPYNVVGLAICGYGCYGAVNGSGWTPCEPTGGCCVRCDIQELSCLWGCTEGPKCITDSFFSPLDSSWVGACGPMCDTPWSTTIT